MFLKEITISGFKAYSQSLRVNFDEKLTTITGSNGSGKSSLTSAILFALNHADSPSDLVNHTCKVATVTIKFSDDTSITRSYDKEKHISRFRINNTLVTTATLTKYLAQYNLSDRSAFCVEQGKITKLININSAQMNDFIKQIAGTKYYEDKTARAMLKIKEKEQTVLGNKENINNTISPFFYKLKQHRQSHFNLKKLEDLKLQQQITQKNLLKNKANKIRAEMLEKMQFLLKNKDFLVEKNKNIQSKPELISKMDEINREKENLEIEELELKIQKLVEKTKETDLLEENYLEIKREYDSLIEINNPTKINEYNKKIENLVKLFSEFQSLINELEIQKKNFKDQKLILNFNKDVCEKLQKNDFNFQKLEKNLLEKFINDFMQIEKEGLLRKNLEQLKSMYQKFRNTLGYQIRDGVYGKVSENYHVNDSKYSIAVDSVIGFKNNYVIVENEIIGAELLSANKITIIPLNKIVVGKFKPVKNAVPLIEFLVFEKNVEKAINFVVNNFYLVENNELAKKICFEEKVFVVVLDGTVYDPRGTLTTNYIRQKSNPEIKLDQIIDQKDFPNQMPETSNILVTIKGIKKLEKIILGLENSEYITNGDIKIILAIHSLINELRMLNEFKNLKDVSLYLDELNKKMLIEHRKYIQNSNNAQKKKILDQEIEEKTKKLAINKEKCSFLNEEIRKLKNTLQDLETESIKEKTREKEIKKILLTKTELNSLNEELKDIVIDEPGNIEENTELIAFFKQCKDIKIDWNKFAIHYSLEDFDYEKKLKELNLQIKGMGSIKMQKLDPRNFDLLEKNEVILEDLEKKILKIEADKQKLIETIQKYNKASEKSVLSALDYMNQHTSKIIQYFIPNSSIEISHKFDLTIKLSNNPVSISALSGGQRSLIALSLLFAALSYNPCPIYVFDEIDAALDVKYCTKIGDMIKKEFKAQFVIVSLREELTRQGDMILKVAVEDQKPVVRHIK